MTKLNISSLLLIFNWLHVAAVSLKFSQIYLANITLLHNKHFSLFSISIGKHEFKDAAKSKKLQQNYRYHFKAKSYCNMEFSRHLIKFHVLILGHFNFAVLPKYYILRHFNFEIWPSCYNSGYINLVIVLKIVFFMCVSFQHFSNFAKK